VKQLWRAINRTGEVTLAMKVFVYVLPKLVAKVLKPEVEIPWDDEGKMAKKHLWKPIQEVMLGKESTTEPYTDEYAKVYDVINRHISTKFGISVPWPVNHEPD